MLRDLSTCELNPNFLSLLSLSDLQWIFIHWFISRMFSNMLMPFVKGIGNSETRQIFMLLAWITCLLCREKHQKSKRLLTDFAAGEQGRWNMAADCLEGFFFFSRTRQKVVFSLSLVCGIYCFSWQSHMSESEAATVLSKTTFNIPVGT